MKIFKKIISACVSAVLLAVAPASAILPPQGEVKVVEGDISRRKGVNPLWLLLLAGYLIVVWLDVEASGFRMFCGRIWTERILLALLLVRVLLLERKVQKFSAPPAPEDEAPAEV